MKPIAKTSDKVTVRKPWGHEEIWALNEHYCGKILTVRKGQKLSLQYHEKKCETLYVLSGIGFIQIGHKRLKVTSGECIEVRPGTRHRIEGESILVLLEVSTPEVEDVVRISDNYGRVGK